jgi:glucuronoarabinoxylan endo-1,4-beta-xylanase
MWYRMLRSVLWVTLVAISGCGGGSGGGATPSGPGPVMGTVPVAPAGASATAGDAQVVLTWNAVAGATGYYANRSTSAGGPYTRLAATNTASFTDTSLANGVTYYYVITAFNAAGTGAQSSEVSATPVAVVIRPPVTIDFAATRQIIRGFGGSSAWITDMNSRPGMADRLFGNTGSEQIGLSILRVRIDPSPDPGNHANWLTELNNARLASARGARVIASPWSPPATMKSNGDVNNGGSLNPDRYADYAQYLQSFVSYMEDGGAPLYAISIQNEPDWSPTYESCVWTGEQLRTWITGHASVLTTRLIMPEAVNLFPGSLPSLADPTLDDPAAAAHVDIVGTHIYGSTPAAYANAVSRNKEVWMTEHTVESSGMQGAMDLAREIHLSLAVANYNAYVYWWLQNWIVGNSSPYEAGLINDPALDLSLTKKGYVLGQFAKFVRPDFVRVEATANPSAGIHVSSYKDTANGRFVIVAINTGQDAISQPFTIQGQAISQLTPYRTSATENIVQLADILVLNDSFSYTLPGSSVTTFVQL